METMEQFNNQKYLNVETFRKDGRSVRTPVWFVEYQGEFCFTTESDSGKVKRIRRNPRVNIAPCKVNGEVTGHWISGTARLMILEEINKVEQIYNKKYGLVKKFFDILGNSRNKPRAFIAVTPGDQP